MCTCLCASHCCACLKHAHVLGLTASSFAALINIAACQATRLSLPATERCLIMLSCFRRKRLGYKGGWDAVMAHPWFSHIDWVALAQRRVKPPSKHRYAGMDHAHD